MAEKSSKDFDKKGGNEGRLWQGPRMIVVPKVDDAFGFTLRNFIVQPPHKTHSFDYPLATEDSECRDAEDHLEPVTVQKSGSFGSGIPMETIFVKQVKEKSKAYIAGLRTGDRIISINGINVSGKSYAQVIRLIHESDSALTMMIIPKDEDVIQMAYKSSAADGDRDGKTEIRSISSCTVSLSPSQEERSQRKQRDEEENHTSSSSSSFAVSSSPRSLQTRLNASSDATNPSLRIHFRINSNNKNDASHLLQITDTSSSSLSGQRLTITSHRLSSSDMSQPPVAISSSGMNRRSLQQPVDYSAYLASDEMMPSVEDGRNRRQNDSSSVSYTISQVDRTSLTPTCNKQQQQRTSLMCNLTTPSSSSSHLLHERQNSPNVLSSHREITLLKSKEDPSSFDSTSSSLRSSSRYIQMGGGVKTNPCLDESKSSPSSNLLSLRQQTFVFARPQSYESLFGVQRGVRSSDELIVAAENSRSSNELGKVSTSSSSSSIAAAAAAGLQASPAISASSASRLSSQTMVGSDHQPKMMSLVSERMRRFESIDGDENNVSSRNGRSRKTWHEDDHSMVVHSQQFGYDSVASRAAQFEQISCGGGEEGRRNVSSTDAAAAVVQQGKRILMMDSLRTSSLQEEEQVKRSRDNWSPSSFRQVPPPSVTIPIYFRADPLSSNMLLSPSLRSRHVQPQSDSVTTAAESVIDVSSCLDRNNSSAALNKFTMRQTSSQNEKTDKSSDNMMTTTTVALTVETISQSTTLAMAATLGIKDQLFVGETCESPSSHAVLSTLVKSGNSNIKKFVAFFTDKAQKTFDSSATIEKKPGIGGELLMTSGNNVITLEGSLVCKVAIADGRKASDRSWKQSWAVLKGHFLCLYKDRSSLLSEEQSICIKSSSVEIASDYLKKKNVFQLTTSSGSKYLFQAEDAELMCQWVKAIQMNSNSKDVELLSVGSTMVIQNTEKGSSVINVSPQVPQKTKKQSIKTMSSSSSKSPSSPMSKSRKQTTSSEKDSLESPRGVGGKEHKTWKGKMVKRFGRNRSGSGVTIEISDDQELISTFGIPLYACPPSLFNECVPLVVEACTRIVEEKGIENQGIYRVPGNTCAVNALRQELDKCPENIDVDSDKWQDVNVVSSLLKLFFRKLPDSLITDELYESVITAYRLSNPEKKMLKLKKLLHDLPEHNFETFRVLAQHLNRVASREEVNKMDARNLAIVFGPTLVRPQDDSMVLMVKDMSDQCRVVETIIVNVDWFFSSWDEDVNVPLSEENEPISTMNPELLAKAENLMNTEISRDVSAKDLVSSIFHAANKKIRRRDVVKSSNKTNADSIEIEGESDVSYNERNIDQEIEIQRIKEQTVPMTTVSNRRGTTEDLEPTASLREDEVETGQQPKGFVEIKRYPAYHFGPTTAVLETENLKPKILRRYSEDAFGLSHKMTEHDQRLLIRDENHEEEERLYVDTTTTLHRKQEMEREKRTTAKEEEKTLKEEEEEEETSSSVVGDSVRSAMDRCKLTMYENRLRFFSDGGSDQKGPSPLYRRQGGSQDGVPSSTLSPLIRRLSDQPTERGGLGFRGEDGLLATMSIQTRSHSVSPSTLGRESKYSFDSFEQDRSSSSAVMTTMTMDKSLPVLPEGNVTSSSPATSVFSSSSSPLPLSLPSFEEMNISPSVSQGQVEEEEILIDRSGHVNQTSSVDIMSEVIITSIKEGRSDTIDLECLTVDDNHHLSINSDHLSEPNDIPQSHDSSSAAAVKVELKKMEIDDSTAVIVYSSSNCQATHDVDVLEQQDLMMTSLSEEDKQQQQLSTVEMMTQQQHPSTSSCDCRQPPFDEILEDVSKAKTSHSDPNRREVSQSNAFEEEVTPVKPTLLTTQMINVVSEQDETNVSKMKLTRRYSLNSTFESKKKRTMTSAETETLVKKLSKTCSLPLLFFIHSSSSSSSS